MANAISNEFELLYQHEQIVRQMIIDFKTKHPKVEYRTQLERYAKAIQVLYTEYPIHCGLFFIATQESVGERKRTDLKIYKKHKKAYNIIIKALL